MSCSGRKLSNKKTYQGILGPRDTLLLVGIGIRETFHGAGLATEQTVQVGADLVALGLNDGVALKASRLEEVGTLLVITWRKRL